MAIDEISLVIPAHNEEKRILNTLRVYSKFFDENFDKADIIVVANNCSDKTVEIIEKFSEGNPSVRVLEIPHKVGKGGAVLAGLKNAKYDYCGFIDADDAFELKDLTRMINSLNDYDVAIASKWIGKSFSEVNEPFFRKIMSRGWNFLIRLMIGIGFSDTQAGAKFFRKSAFNSINHNFICTGFEFDVELLCRFKNKNLNILEVPVTTRHMPNSSFKVSSIYSMFRKLIKLSELKSNLK
ncbi:MAG: glycosyltransferase [Candidatus Nanoarchaeia archaeon]|nr:glycosyltransferase [Candidatus Nanoarchaeia archaeon]